MGLGAVEKGHVWLPVPEVLESSIALLFPVPETVPLRVNPAPAVSVTAVSEPNKPSTKSLAFNVVTPVASAGVAPPPPLHFEF